MSAALFGASLAGPLAASAFADDSGSPSSSGTGATAGETESQNSDSPAASPQSSAPTAGTTAQTGGTPFSSTSDPSAAGSESSSSSASASTITTSVDDKTTVSAQTNRGSVASGRAESAGGQGVSAQSNSGSSAAGPKSAVSASIPTTAPTKEPATAALVTAPGAEPVVAAANPQPAIAAPTTPWVVKVTGASDPYSDVVNYNVAGFFGVVQALITGAPLPEPLKAALTGTAYTVRRSLLNAAPTVTPLQVTGASDTAVTGRVSAVDPDGDQIAYRVVKGPASGTLQLSSDGSFTYTPGDEFDGVASFVVLARDLGMHVNLLNPFRGAGTSARALVNEGAIKFNFDYTTGADFWSDEARAALASSAIRLTTYFLVTRPVTLDYDVAGVNSTDPSSSLASAGSNLVSGNPGFWRTVVQNKLISGVDSNGTAADGSIEWNFGYGWGYGESVGADDYDFVSTAMHEVLHSFGFLSVIDAPGENAGGEWLLFDSFVRTAGGAKPIRSDHEWNPAYDPNLTGANGGLYFGGANAVAAYGGLVPLFTPNPFESGSSITHLDDATFTGANQQLMNAQTGTGLGVRVLSPIELGILKDIGYTVVIPSVAV